MIKWFLLLFEFNIFTPKKRWKNNQHWEGNHFCNIKFFLFKLIFFSLKERQNERFYFLIAILFCSSFVCEFLPSQEGKDDDDEDE